MLFYRLLYGALALIVVSTGVFALVRSGSLLAMVATIMVDNEDAILNPLFAPLAAPLNLSSTRIFVGNEDAKINPLLSSSIGALPESLSHIFVGNQDAIVEQALSTTLAPHTAPLSHVFIGNSDATLGASFQSPEFSNPLSDMELVAERFKPVLYFTESEKYRPQEIRIALETGELYKSGDFVAEQPKPLTEEYIGSKTESDYKIDLAGNIFLSKSPIDGKPYENTAYVHFVEDEGHIVLQYWFFYYFNDWDGAPFGLDFTHEGDWEFIQFIFPRGESIRQIIEKNLTPQTAVYSAHLGGYSLDWNDVRKEKSQPFVYVTKGSHANHFQPGFCDLISPVVVELPFVVNTDEAKQNKSFSVSNSDSIFASNLAEFEWLLFGGQWGIDYNSPESILKQEGGDRWSNPVSWKNTDTIEWNQFYNNHCDIDTDGDGMFDKVDSPKNTPSNIFNDGITTGKILEQGTGQIRIKDLIDDGVFIDIPANPDGTAFSLDCSPLLQLYIAPNDLFRGTGQCGSAKIIVDRGKVQLSTTLNTIEITGTLESGQGILFKEFPNKFEIEVLGETPVTLTANGEQRFSFGTEQPISVIHAPIDIKPDNDHEDEDSDDEGINKIKCEGKGVIPVAILSTEQFDATTIDHTTVRFEGALETHTKGKHKALKRHEEDTNDDGLMDLMFHFRQQETALTCNSTKATLTGTTFTGDIVIGTDTMTMVGKKEVEYNESKKKQHSKSKQDDD